MRSLEAVRRDPSLSNWRLLLLNYYFVLFVPFAETFASYEVDEG